jgi:hypothetical protein
MNLVQFAAAGVALSSGRPPEIVLASKSMSSLPE